ncbi:MAG: NAD(P)H-binding protein [Cyclobacteriaceae bacterium]
MTTLIVGASGETGKQLVEQLLNMGEKVKVIVRPTGKIPDNWNDDARVSIVKTNVSEISLNEMADHIHDCQAIASCLGHNPTLKGVFGKPRNLVTNTVRLLCSSVKKNSPESSVKFVLMNTAGNQNRDLDEPISFGQRIVISVLRLLLPPHVDNENAADYLRTNVGQEDDLVEWVTVRPDNLVNEEKFTEYDVHPSPTRSALFNPGKTSRINVGHFMAQLITENKTWNKWKGQMPVIYNR